MRGAAMFSTITVKGISASTLSDVWSRVTPGQGADIYVAVNGIVLVRGECSNPVFVDRGVEFQVFSHPPKEDK